MNSHPLAAIASTMSAGHHTFTELANELFAENPEGIDFDDLPERDRRKLAAAYIRDTRYLDEVLSSLNQAVMAGFLADLLAHPSRAAALDDFDAIEFAGEVHKALWPNRDIELLIDSALLEHWEAWDRQRAQEREVDKAEERRLFERAG